MTVQGDGMKLEYRLKSWVYGRGGEWLKTKNSKYFLIRVVLGIKYTKNAGRMSWRTAHLLTLKSGLDAKSVIKDLIGEDIPGDNN